MVGGAEAFPRRLESICHTDNFPQSGMPTGDILFHIGSRQFVTCELLGEVGDIRRALVDIGDDRPVTLLPGIK